MSGPVRPWRTSQELRAGATPYDAITRGAWLVFAVTQPLMVVVMLVTRWALGRTSWRARWYVPAAIVVAVGSLLAGTVRPYVRPWREAGELVASELGHAGVREKLLQLVAAQWPSWLLAQAGLAVGIGVLLGAVSAARRARLRATWRDDAPLSKGDPEKVRAALAKMPPATPARSFDASPIRLGIDHRTQKPYEVTAKELGNHALLLMPTGFGKTTLLVRIVAELMVTLGDFRCPVVLINMKPDPDITEQLKAIAAQAGRRFRYVTHDGACGSESYNPLLRGSPHELASAVVDAEAFADGGGFSEPHHRRSAERYLHLVCAALAQLSQAQPEQWPQDYLSLAQLMHPNAMSAASSQISGEVAQLWRSYQAELTADRGLRDSISGLRQRIAGAAESAARPVLRDSAGGLVLEDAIDAGDMVLFDLDATADTNAAQLLGNLALKDLQRTLARMAGRRWNKTPAGETARYCLTIVDEFPALGGSILDASFRRSRSHGGPALLSTQEAGALDEAGATFKEMVTTNANVQLIGRQAVNAEWFAGLAGTESAMEETTQVYEDATLLADAQVYASGQGSLRRVDRFVIAPNLLRDLGIGELVATVNTRPRAEAVAVVSVARWTITKPAPAAPPAAPAVGLESGHSGHVDEPASVEPAAAVAAPAGSLLWDDEEGD